MNKIFLVLVLFTIVCCNVETSEGGRNWEDKRYSECNSEFCNNEKFGDCGLEPIPTFSNEPCYFEYNQSGDYESYIFEWCCLEGEYWMEEWSLDEKTECWFLEYSYADSNGLCEE